MRVREHVTQDWERKVLQQRADQERRSGVMVAVTSWGYLDYYGNKRPAVSDGTDVIFLTAMGEPRLAISYRLFSRYRPQVVVRPSSTRLKDIQL